MAETVREACRKRRPLEGADAQALEHALSITERERDQWRDRANAMLAAARRDNACTQPICSNAAHVTARRVEAAYNKPTGGPDGGR